MADDENTAAIWQLKKSYDARLPDNIRLLEFPINLLELQALLISELIEPEHELAQRLQDISDKGSNVSLGALNWRKAFWKRVIRQLEEEVVKRLQTDGDADDEVADKILLYYTDLLSAIDTGPGTSLRRFHFRCQDVKECILTVEDDAAISEGTTGLRTWHAALNLANHLISRSDIVVGKNLLELGCGAGLLALLVAILQRNQGTGFVIGTDLHDSVLARVRQNIDLNGVTGLSVSRLDWSSPETFDPQRTPDIILAADVVYDPDLAPVLASCLSDLMRRSSPCEALICLTIRNIDTFKIFKKACENHRLQLCEIPPESPPVDRRLCTDANHSDEIRLFRVVLRRTGSQIETSIE